MAPNAPLPPPPPKPPGFPSLPGIIKPPGAPIVPVVRPAATPGLPPAGLKKETMRLASPPKPPVPGVPAAPPIPMPAVSPSLATGGGAPATPPTPVAAKPGADLRKETMRISLPPRPGGAGATVALPSATKPPMPGAEAHGSRPAIPGASPGKPTGSPMPAQGVGRPAVAAPAAVHAVVDTDGAGTALAIAALVASLISFGVVVMSFLQK